MSSEGWAATLAHLRRGDAAELAALSRIATASLVRMRAYDFRDEWPDLIQEVVTAAVVAARRGKIEDPPGLVAYVRATARNRFADRLRKYVRRREDRSLPWEDEMTQELVDPPRSAPQPLARIDLQRLLEKLDPGRREAIVEVYLKGRTYDEASAHLDLPLGTLKRWLREGLAELRSHLNDDPQEERSDRPRCGDPSWGGAIACCQNPSAAPGGP